MVLILLLLQSSLLLSQLLLQLLDIEVLLLEWIALSHRYKRLLSLELPSGTWEQQRVAAIHHGALIVE